MTPDDKRFIRDLAERLMRFPEVHHVGQADADSLLAIVRREEEHLSEDAYVTRLQDALIAIVSNIGGRPPGIDVDRYAGYACEVATLALAGQPFLAVVLDEEEGP